MRTENRLKTEIKFKTLKLTDEIEKFSSSEGT